MKKKLLSLALALVLCLGLTVPAFAAETITETFYGIMITASSDGTLSFTGSGTLTQDHMDVGYHMFFDVAGEQIKTAKIHIGANISYDESWSAYAKELFSYEDVNVVISNAPAETVGGFSDVKPGDWFADPVLWAVLEKITSGTSATTFSPNTNCTVAEILTFLWRAKGSPAPSISNPFSDVTSSDWYYKAALWAYEKGMVTGTTFAGDRPCTRSMAVTYLWKMPGTILGDATDFSIDKNGILRSYKGSGGDVVIPYGVTEINSNAFKGCEGLTSVTIPSSVTWIGERAFAGCSSLTSVTMPSSVTFIQSTAFNGCDNITDVYYGGSEAQLEDLCSGMVYGVDLLFEMNPAIHYNSVIPDPTQEAVETGFSDVPATADYAQAVAWAVEKGVTTGTSATTFSPDAVCTRGQIVTFLYRVLAD